MTAAVKDGNATLANRISNLLAELRGIRADVGNIPDNDPEWIVLGRAFQTLVAVEDELRRK